MDLLKKQVSIRAHCRRTYPYLEVCTIPMCAECSHRCCHVKFPHLHHARKPWFAEVGQYALVGCVGAEEMRRQAREIYDPTIREVGCDRRRSSRLQRSSAGNTKGNRICSSRACTGQAEERGMPQTSIYMVVRRRAWSRDNGLGAHRSKLNGDKVSAMQCMRDRARATTYHK